MSRLALLIAFVVAAQAFLGYGRAGSYEFIGAVWPDEMVPVPYCVNASATPIGSTGEPILTPEGFAYLVQSAFQKWEDLPDSRVSFAYTGLCQNDPWDWSDGVNTIGWGKLWGGAAGLADPTGTHGNYMRGGDYGQLYEVDIIIDTRNAQSFDDMAYYIDVVLPHILVHEAGHFLGLGHSQVECSVMSPSGIRPGLCWDDALGAATLYPER